MRRYENKAKVASLTTGWLATDAAPTTIEVNTTAGWPAPGAGDSAIGALDYGNEDLVELFEYTGLTATSFTGVTLAKDGTTRQDHAVGATVRHIGSAKDVETAARVNRVNLFTEDQSVENTNHLLLGTGSAIFVGDGGASYTYNAVYDGTKWVRRNADADVARMYIGDNGDYVFEVATDAGTTAGSAITWTQRFRIAKDGTVTGSVAKAANVQTFSASGTWTKPAGAKVVVAYLFGGGGGGGGGQGAASGLDRKGASGGGGGAFAISVFDAADLGDTESVTIGAGGNGGNGGASAEGSGGATGGATAFADQRAYGGAGGLGSSASRGGGGGGSMAPGSGTTGGAGDRASGGSASTNSQNPGSPADYGGAGGGGGYQTNFAANGGRAVVGGGGGGGAGGCQDNNTYKPAAIGGGRYVDSTNSNGGGGAAGADGGGAGGIGAAGTKGRAGDGGGGGGGNLNGTGGAGGAGGVPNGAGGGGGGGTTTGGKGGAGSRGEAIIITFF